MAMTSPVIPKEPLKRIAPAQISVSLHLHGRRLRTRENIKPERQKCWLWMMVVFWQSAPRCRINQRRFPRSRSGMKTVEPLPHTSVLPLPEVSRSAKAKGQRTLLTGCLSQNYFKTLFPQRQQESRFLPRWIVSNVCKHHRCCCCCCCDRVAEFGTSGMKDTAGCLKAVNINHSDWSKR